MDDENSSKIKRKSYMAIVRKKVQLFGLLTTIIIAKYVSMCLSFGNTSQSLQIYVKLFFVQYSRWLKRF